MAKMLNWNPAPAIADCVKGSMARLELAANVIRDDAKRRLASKLKETYREHGSYRTMRDKGKRSETRGTLILYGTSSGAGASWTARQHGAMLASIRVVKRQGTRDVWIMAGNYNTWWALQLEYGHGQWRGGAKSFLRPALAASASKVAIVLEGGAIAGVTL